jgi:hypothetical protein
MCGVRALRLGSLATWSLPGPGLGAGLLVVDVVDPCAFEELDVVLPPRVVVVPCAVVVGTGLVVVVGVGMVVVVVVTLVVGGDVVVVAPTTLAVPARTAIAAMLPAVARHARRRIDLTPFSPTAEAPLVGTGPGPVVAGRSVMWLEHGVVDPLPAADTHAATGARRRTPWSVTPTGIGRFGGNVPRALCAAGFIARGAIGYASRRGETRGAKPCQDP